MGIALFARSAVAQHADVPTIIDAVEDAFEAHATGQADMPPKSYIDLPQYAGDFRSMPAYVDGESGDAAGIKWVNAHPNNPDAYGLPSVMGVYVYSDPETGRPLAVMDGTELTRVRTAAAAAVATDHLAVPDASRLGIVGAGAQSYLQVEAQHHVRDIEEIVVSDTNPAAIERFIDRFDDRFSVSSGTIPDAGHCDILITLTPVRDPIVSREALGERTHVNAMGADAEGKQELDPSILTNATLVIDDYEQCTHSGEINVPWATGTVTDADLHGTLGDVLTGEVAGRTSGSGGITVFDSTGLAIQDVAAARVVYAHGGEEVPTFDLLELS